MAGHSHWKSIKHRKGAADAKRGKVFSKMAKLIMVAARHGGPNPADNLRLRYAIERARAESMPKDSIDRAVKKGAGEIEAEELYELTYEGILPGGVSIIVEVLTDNRNRTGGEIRNLLEKRGGELGKANSVMWKFDHRGIIVVSPDDATEEEVFEIALEAGAENIETTEEGFVVSTKKDDFESVRSALQDLVVKKRAKPEKKWGEEEDDRPLFTRSELAYVPQVAVPIEGEKAKKILGLVNDIEEHEDVQNVYCDFDVSEEVLQEIAEEE